MTVKQDPVEQLVRSVLAVEPSSDFKGRIRERVRQEAIKRKAGPNWALIVSGFTAAVALVLMMTNLHHEEPARTETLSTPIRSEVATRDALVPSTEPPRREPLHGGRKRVPDVDIANVAHDPEPSSEVDAGPLKTESLPSPELKEFALGTTSEPLTVTALAAPHALPLFEIRQFSLLSSNQGVAE